MNPKNYLYNNIKYLCVLVGLICCITASAQNEVIDNDVVIKMTKAGLSAEIIKTKINRTNTRFDVSSTALIALKDAKVEDEIITRMLEVADKVLPGKPPRTTEPFTFSKTAKIEPKEAVKLAKTISFQKSSAHPSRQNLEKALLKSESFNTLGLTILRGRDDADLFVEIGFVSGSWITHRYVYRIYDRRSGAVLSAGETTSWGSLADNLAKHITRDLTGLKSNSN